MERYISLIVCALMLVPFMWVGLDIPFIAFLAAIIIWELFAVTLILILVGVIKKKRK